VEGKVSGRPRPSPFKALAELGSAGRAGMPVPTRSGVAHERNAGKFAAEVGGVALAVLGVMQYGVDVMEDVPLGDGAVAVAGAKLFERCSIRHD
jgi:hypothetical protein